MKSKSGFFQRILSFFIISGILAGLCLVYLGYEKSEKAIDKNPIANLYPTYVGETTVPVNYDASIFNEVLNQVIAADPDLIKLASFFSDHTLAEVITEQIYLPKDETVSTAIGQRFTVHRLEEAYSQEELLLICYGLLGYDINRGELPDFSATTTEKNSIDLSRLSADAQSFLSEILDFIKNQLPNTSSSEQK